MKRIIKLVIALALFSLVFQVGIHLLIQKHTISYGIYEGKAKFEIEENFAKQDDHHDYQFLIRYRNLEFPFQIERDYHKQKKVVEKIEYKETEDMVCIYPILKEKVETTILCNQRGTLFSYRSLKQMKNEEVELFLKELQNKQYHSSLWEEEGQLQYQNMTINDNYIPRDYVIAVWNYKGLDLISRGKQETLQLLKKDHYENTHGTLIGQYYYVPNYDMKYHYSEFFLINLKNAYKNNILTPEEISYDSYINGVVDGTLYLTDRDSKIQYSFETKNRFYNIVGDKNTKAKVYQDGTWEERNIYDLTNTPILFTEKVETPKVISELQPKLWKESRTSYYILDNQGRMYQILKENPEMKILLFQDETITDFEVVEDTIFYLSNGIIYSYHLFDGWHPLIGKNEFRFNSQNIYHVIKK